MGASAITDEQRAFQETARRFARERLAPGYMAREREGRIDRALIAEMGALGLIGVDLPEAFGGLGQPSVTAGLVIEAVAHGDFNVGQLLDDGRRLVVVDTDTLCAAPAEYDPASYCANVVSGRPDDLDDARELARVVRGAARGRLDADVFDWYLAAMVVRRLDRAIRRTKRDWPERTERLVEAAEELLR